MFVRKSAPGDMTVNPRAGRRKSLATEIYAATAKIVPADVWGEQNRPAPDVASAPAGEWVVCLLSVGELNGACDVSFTLGPGGGGGGGRGG